MDELEIVDENADKQIKKSFLKRALKLVIIMLSALMLIVVIGLGITYAVISARLSYGIVPTVEMPWEYYSGGFIGMPEVIELAPDFIEFGDKQPRIEHEGDDYIFERSEISDRIVNIMIFGDDARIHETRARSDAMILFTFNRDTNEIHLTSFMRDIFAPQTLDGEDWFLLNAIYAAGGPGRALNVINHLFSLDIQRYVVLRFASVFELVDALGGLELYLRADEADWLSNIFIRYEPLVPGMNLMNGRQVLAYSRLRAIDPRGDFVRVDRQRYVIQTAVDRVLAVRTFGEISGLASFALEHVETNIPLSELLTLAFEMYSGGRPEMSEMRVPIDGSFRRAAYRGAFISVIDFRSNIMAVHNFIFGNTNNARVPEFIRPYVDDEIEEEYEDDNLGEDDDFDEDNDLDCDYCIICEECVYCELCGLCKICIICIQCLLDRLLDEDDTTQQAEADGTAQQVETDEYEENMGLPCDEEDGICDICELCRICRICRRVMAEEDNDEHTDEGTEEDNEG